MQSFYKDRKTFACSYNHVISYNNIYVLRVLNDDKIFSSKTKLIILSILRAFQIYNLLLYMRYFLIKWERNQSFSFQKNIFHRSMNVQNCKCINISQKEQLYSEYNRKMTNNIYIIPNGYSLSRTYYSSHLN